MVAQTEIHLTSPNGYTLSGRRVEDLDDHAEHAVLLVTGDPRGTRVIIRLDKAQQKELATFLKRED